MIISDISLAAEKLKQNELVAIPTETVYGLAANALNAGAVSKIFELKKRPTFNPLIVHLKGTEQLTELAEDIPDSAYKLAAKFWPGPLTMILKKKAIVPDVVTANKPTVAVRVPNHPLTQALLAQLPFPLAAPSANPFSSISPTTAQHVEGFFGDQLCILDGGACQKGLESTIIGFEDGQPVVYRLGALSIESIEAVVGLVKTFNHDDQSPVAPGMLSKHYAPETPTIQCLDLEKEILAQGEKKIGLIVFQSATLSDKVEQIEVLSAQGDLEEAAKNLYAAMHRLDRCHLDVILAETFPNRGIGKTINDKLNRASKA